MLQALLAKAPDDRPDHAQLREMLSAVALVSVGARSAPMEPAEALDRMFHRDDDVPQLHLIDPDLYEPPVPEPVAVDADGEPIKKPRPLPPPKAKKDLRTRIWTVVCALSIVGVLGSLLAAGGHKAVVRKKATELAVQWKTYKDDNAGYSINHPGGWTLAHEGNLTDFRDPATGAALRVGYQQPPQNTPLGLWLTLEEEFKAEHPSYQRIRLSQTVHDGYPGAVWEFTWTDNGVDLHNYDLAFITGPQSYALNFQTRESDWLAPSAQPSTAS